MTGGSADPTQVSRSTRGSVDMSSAAFLKRSYSCSRRTKVARGSSSSSSASLERGKSIRDLISASMAAIRRYSAASSNCMASISSTYCMYCSVITATSISKISRFWRRIRYSSKSSGPSKASRKTSSARGGMYKSFGNSVTASPCTTANGISPCCG